MLICKLDTYIVVRSLIIFEENYFVLFVDFSRLLRLLVCILAYKYLTFLLGEK